MVQPLEIRVWRDVRFVPEVVQTATRTETSTSTKAHRALRRTADGGAQDSKLNRRRITTLIHWRAVARWISVPTTDAVEVKPGAKGSMGLLGGGGRPERPCVSGRRRGVPVQSTTSES